MHEVKEEKNKMFVKIKDFPHFHEKIRKSEKKFINQIFVNLLSCFRDIESFTTTQQKSKRIKRSAEIFFIVINFSWKNNYFSRIFFFL